MGSLFEIGKSGVQAYRQALSVTGQNISNVNTDGYNKRAADLEEVPSVQGGVTNVPDQSGLGVRVNQIRRSFDTFLAANARSTNSQFQKLDKFVDDLNRLENMLLPADSDLGVFIGRFFNSLQDIASKPDELSSRTVAIENGKALANSFNTYDRQIEDFKNTAVKEASNAINEVNQYIKQLAQVNKLIMSGGSKNTSPDILDARDKLLSSLSKFVDFSIDYGGSGEVKITLGSSGNGNILLEKTNQSVLESSIQESRIVYNSSRDGVKTVVNDLSEGLLSGIKNFYEFTGGVQSEISDLAARVTRDFNEIQNNGIDLNGKKGASMFSVNSMISNTDSANKSNIEVDIIVGNEDKIKQEKMIFKYISAINSWEVSSSSGIKNYNASQLDFDGFSLSIKGQAIDGDKFTINPSSTKAAAFKFLLKDPKSIAAASESLISASLDNTSKSELNVIGKEKTIKSEVPKINEVFSSSSNPLLSTEFLKDGTMAIIPTNVKELKLSSLSKQSSATFGMYDSQIKGFSNISINLSDGNSITLSSASTDPGDGIKSVKELAEMLNSGLLLDGVSQHNFRKYGLFASGADGGLTISASDATVSSASILSNGNTYSASISQIDASNSSASKIQIFTKDGRHVSGTSLSATEIATLMKESNGFLKNAEYRNDYLNSKYRGISSSRISAKGDYVQNLGSNISFDKQSTDEDGLFTNKSATSLSGSLTLDGILEDSKDLNGFVTFISSHNDSGITYTIKGYDQDGRFQTESITGANASSITGTKIFKSISSISASGNGSGDLKIGIKSSGYTLKVVNDKEESNTTTIPVNSSAFYTAGKLNKDLVGTGVSVSAATRVLLGPLKPSSSGTMSFKLKGSNSESVSISSTVDSDDLSGLSRIINQYSSQTGIQAFNTTDFDRLVLLSEEGHDLELTDIISPSDFDLTLLDSNFKKLSEKHEISSTNNDKKSAYIRGNLTFVSSSQFTTQIDSGLVKSSSQDLTKNSFYDIKYNNTGEKVTINPIALDNLDDNVSGSNGKRAQAGLSTYGLSIPLNTYEVEASDDDSLYTSANPGGAASGKSFTGSLRNASNLNSVVTITCAANESSNSFFISGTDKDGNTVFDKIQGVNNGVAIGSQVFKTVTSFETTATANGTVKIGTKGRHEIVNNESLVKKATYSSGAITMTEVLSTASYLGAKIRVESYQDESTNSFTITGEDSGGNTLTETISGSNGTTTVGNKIFHKISSISVANNTSGDIRIGTIPGDSNWSGTINASAIDADTSSEISSALISKIREESPTSQLIGKVISNLPSDDTRLELTFEGQTYKIKMRSGEPVIEGPELNRVKARYEETSVLDNDALALSQAGSAGNALTLNGNSASTTFLGTKISIKSVGDESKNQFTIAGTDLDGNSISESIFGPSAGQSVTGSKIFKTITSVTPKSATAGNVEIGTAPGYKLYVTAEGTIEGDQFELLQNTTNLSLASQFGVSEGITTLKGHLAIKPSASDIPFEINIDRVDSNDDFSIKFLKDTSTSSVLSSIAISAASALGTPSTDELGGKITITTASSGDRSGVKFTVVGKDMFGNALTEVINGAGDGLTSTGTKVFKTVTSVTPDSTTGSGNIEVGHLSQPVFFNLKKDINLFKSKVVSANTALGTPSAHSSLGGKIKISTAVGGNQSSTTFTVVGIGADGGALSETIAGQTGGQSILGSKIFKSVTSITPGGTVGTGSIDVEYSVIPQLSLTPPSDITLSWTENASGSTDTDSLYLSSSVSSGTAIQLSGVLTSQDSDSLFTIKSAPLGELLLDGALKESKDIRGKVQIIFAGNETGKTYTVAGYDLNGVYKTDVISGLSGATATGTIDYKEVLSVTASAASAGNITIGTKATSSSVNGSIVSITSAADESSNKFTVVGKDMFDNDITEVIAGGNATTVNGKKVFKSITTITPTNNSSGNIQIGTVSSGRLSIEHKVGKSNFLLDSSPNVQDIYGIKTQKTRVTLNEGKIELNSLSGKPIRAEIPEGSTSNIVSEQITLSNFPSEDFIAIVMGGGARKINAEFDFANDNIKFDPPEYEIKIDKNNQNKVEIFDKKYGHSISTRIIDSNRSFEAVGSRFQFSEEALIGESFVINNNKSGSGDNRNVINMIDLQLEKFSDKGKGNFQQIFSNTLAKVGSNVQANKMSLTASSSNKDSAEGALSEFSGVSLDDEAAHLLKFQQAYQASARLLQTARELFQSLMEVV